MFTPPIIIPVRSSPRPDPQCPHCDKTLKGWSEPTEMTFKEFILVIMILMAGIGTFFSSVIGFLDSGFYVCDRPFSKRYHYVMPLYPLSCGAGRWLRNEEQIYKTEEKKHKDDSEYMFNDRAE